MAGRSLCPSIVPVPRVPPPLRLPLAAALVALAVAAALASSAFGARPQASIQEAGGGAGWGALAAAAATLLLGWVRTGTRILARTPQLARERVGIHAWVSVAALALAVFHAVLLARLGDFRGFLSGSLCTGLLLGLLVTGWWRDALSAKWGRRAWRVLHWELALGALAIGVEHWLLIEASTA